MNTKNLISVIAVGSVMQIAAQPQKQPTVKHPNILWLTYEDTSPQFIGCYGNEHAHTPNIDGLAAEGVRFDAAFSTGAVSAPSRFCLITGLRPTSYGTGNHRSQYRIPDDIKGFPYYLRQVGYYTTNNSKTDYNLANPKKLIAEAWNESSDKAGWWNRKPGQPFFAVYNSMSSHQSRTMTHTWNYYENTVLNHLEKHEKITPKGLEIPSIYRDSPEMQKQISRVYNSISLMDKEFGQWLKRLEDEGLRDSTIIFCFSDHGEGITRGKGSAVGMGYKIAFVAWFPPMYQHLSPWGSGVVTDELVSFEDFAPTVLKLAGVEIPEYMQGRSFIKDPSPAKEYVFPAVDRTDESSELSRSITDGRYLYTKVFMPFQPFVRWNMYYDVSDLQQIIRREYKNKQLNAFQSSMLEPRSSEYLYDLKNDKWEIHNLIDQKELQPLINKMRMALKKELIGKRDAHFLTEYTIKNSQLSPYELASDLNLYPIESILDVAFTIGEGEQVIETQLKAMTDTNPLVRYWASIGLFSQPMLSAQQRKTVAKLLTKERFAPTLINLRLTLFKNYDEKKHINDIKRIILQEEDPELLRIAINLLITCNDNLLSKVLPEVERRLQIAEQSNDKKMAACEEYMRLIIHRLKAVPLKPIN